MDSIIKSFTTQAEDTQDFENLVNTTCAGLLKNRYQFTSFIRIPEAPDMAGKEQGAKKLATYVITSEHVYYDEKKNQNVLKISEHNFGQRSNWQDAIGSLCLHFQASPIKDKRPFCNSDAESIATSFNQNFFVNWGALEDKMKTELNPEDSEEVREHIYTFSLMLDDIKALDVAKHYIHEGLNKEVQLEAMLAAANLLLHRAKRSDMLELYERVFNACDLENPNERKIALNALDNKWRMIHHHPRLKLGTEKDMLAIIKRIQGIEPDYTSPELGIFYQFTPKDLTKARDAYITTLRKGKNEDRADSDFWFYDTGALGLLIATVENVDPSDYVKNILQIEEEESQTAAIRLIELIRKIAEEDKRTLALLEADGQKVSDLFSKIQVIAKLLDPESHKKSDDGSMEIVIADLLAPRHPELSQQLRRRAIFKGEKHATYAFRDFQEKRTADFPNYTLKDFIF